MYIRQLSGTGAQDLPPPRRGPSNPGRRTLSVTKTQLGLPLDFQGLHTKYWFELLIKPFQVVGCESSQFGSVSPENHRIGSV